MLVTVLIRPPSCVNHVYVVTHFVVTAKKWEYLKQMWKVMAFAKLVNDNIFCFHEEGSLHEE